MTDPFYKGKSKQPDFDSIHRRYDLLNHVLSFGIDYYWRYRMWSVLDNTKEAIILDLASGTGDSAKGLVRRGCFVVGADLSLEMLRSATKKLRSPKYHAVACSGYELPFRDNSFDGMVCAFGIRNMHNTEVALKEAYRVLKPHSKAVFLEFSMPEGVISGLYRFYLKRLVPLIASLLSSKEAYEYLAESVEHFPARSPFCRMLTEVGFQSCKYTDMTFGIVTLYEAQLKNK